MTPVANQASQPFIPLWLIHMGLAIRRYLLPIDSGSTLALVHRAFAIGDDDIHTWVHYSGSSMKAHEHVIVGILVDKDDLINYQLLIIEQLLIRNFYLSTNS